MKDPSVLILVGSLGYGGAEMQVSLLAAALPAEGIRLQVACFAAGPEYRAPIEAAGASVNILPRGRDRRWFLRAYPEIVRLMRLHQVELVQAFLPSFDIFAPFLRFAFPRVVVVTSRRTMDDRVPPRQLRMMRLTQPLVHAVVANSNAVADSVRRFESVPEPRLRVIVNGILPRPAVRPEEREAARRRFGLAPDECAVLYLAHFRNGKGHQHLPAVIRGVVERHPRARFLVVGDMDSSSQYRTIAARFQREVEAAGIAARVITPGFQRDVASCYAASDIVLNLSDFEGMSNVIMEAMNAALPLVVSDAGGARELVTDGVHAFVVPRADAPAAIERLGVLLADDALGRRMGAAARAHIEETFSVTRLARAYASLYRELLAR